MSLSWLGSLHTAPFPLLLESVSSEVTMAMPLFPRLSPTSLPAFLFSRGWESSFSVPARLQHPLTVGPPVSQGQTLAWKRLAFWAQKCSSGPGCAALACAPLFNPNQGLLRWLSGKESTCQCRRHGFHPWVRKIPWRRESKILAWEMLWTEEPGGL